MTINSEQIQALKAAAEKATPGEWGIQFGDEIYASDGVNHEQIAMLFSDNSARDAEFIAAANPAAILPLLAERDADKALLAEQAKRIVQLEISCDRNYVEGMKTGWNYCDAGNSDGFNSCVEQREKNIREDRASGITLVVGE